LRFLHEDGNDDDQFLESSQARDHFHVGCLVRLLADPSWSEAGPFYFLLSFVLFVMLIGGQLFWIGRIVGLGERFIPGKPRRVWLRIIVGVTYLFFFAYNFAPGTARGAIRPI